MSAKKSEKNDYSALIKGKWQPEFIYAIHKKNLSSETYKKTLNKTILLKTIRCKFFEFVSKVFLRSVDNLVDGERRREC